MSKNIMVLVMALSMVAGTTTLSPASALGIGPGISVTVNLSVESADMNGDAFSGQWVELWKDGVIIQEDFTPFSADVKLGKQYQVFIYDDPAEAKFFDHWEDGSTDQMRTITPLLDTSLTAFFQTDVISNNPPGAGDDFAETTLDTPVIIDVLANDSDEDGDELSIDDIVVTPQNGQAFINPDGTITYAPDVGFVGTDTFEYLVSDGTDSDTALVTVDVLDLTPTNSPPEAGDDFAETQMDIDVTIDVLANDFDPDGDDLFTDSIVRFADNGDVAINEDGTVTYFPFEGFVGTDSFEYSVSDGTDSDTAMVTVTVNG